MNLKYIPLNALPNSNAALEVLHKTVFGPGRFARSAYRLREGVSVDATQSTAALLDGQLVGAVIMTPITIGSQRAMLLGPLAVLPAHEGQGIGTQLMQHSLDAALAAGETFVVLVGDAPYYARIGFKPIPKGQIQFSGPVNPARLLGCSLVEGAIDTMQGQVHTWA